MSVRPVTFHPDGSIDVITDENGHSGTISINDIHYITNIDGSDNHNLVILTCPDNCGATSTHPVGGGAAPPEVQEMFARLYGHKGCPCGLVMAGQSLDLTKSHAKKHCDNMDGKGRWQLDDVPQTRPGGEGEALFDILIEVNSHYIVGIGPFPPGDPAEGYVIEAIPEEFYEEACKDGAKYNPLTKELSNDRTGFQHVLDGSNGTN